MTRLRDNYDKGAGLTESGTGGRGDDSLDVELFMPGNQVTASISAGVGSHIMRRPGSLSKVAQFDNEDTGH